MSDGNAYAEALFRTAKYRPEFPTKGFDTLEQARARASNVVHGCNVEHRHSGIRYVSPAQRHDGQEASILPAWQTLYEAAHGRNPVRWSAHAQPDAHWSSGPQPRARHGPRSSKRQER